jgi:DNA invertase Pin-like site-specific DNA recombinase
LQGNTRRPLGRATVAWFSKYAALARGVLRALAQRPGFGRIRDGSARILFALLAVSRNPSRKWRVVLVFRDGFRDDLFVDGVAAYGNAVRIGYARVSGPTQYHQMQLDALADAGCREVIVETASTRGERPKLRATLNTLKPGDTLVIYKPDRVARSMKELLEDDLHAKDINLHILTGICAGVHRPNAASIAEKMLFMVASMAAEMERDLIRERTLDGLAAAAAQGRTGGRPPVLDPDTLAIALARRGRGESVTAIAAHLKIGRSTLYRALQPAQNQASVVADGPAPPTVDNGCPPGSVTTPVGLADAPWRPVPARIRQPDEPLSSQERERRDRLVGQRESMRASRCPTCGNEPLDAQTRWHQRQDLAITWLYPDPADPLRVVERVHCSVCQPHQQAATVVCELCGDGPLLAGDLAAAANDDLPSSMVLEWLVDKGWQVSPLLLCPDHPHPLHEPGTGTGSGYSSSSGSSGASGSRSGRRPPPGSGR